MNKKKIFILGSLVVSSVFMLGNVNAEEKSVPINLHIEPTAIDVTLPESINMIVKANDVNAEVGDIEVMNNSLVGVIEIRNIQANAINGYTKVENTSDFKRMPMNSKQVSLQINEHDLFNDFKEIIEIDPETSHTLNLSGKSNPTTQLVTGSPFEVILTIGYK